jgi:uncharacterized membrane protein YqaE (UPF0057 family)
MKKILCFLFIPVSFIVLCSFLVTAPSTEKKSDANTKQMETMLKDYKQVLEVIDYDMAAFSKLTPKQFKEITGKKMGVKDVLKLKYAQKQLKKQMEKPMAGEDLPKIAYVLLVIIGFGFLPIGLLSDWSGSDWWVNLLLSLLCWLPGVIHGLVVMKKYY